MSAEETLLLFATGTMHHRPVEGSVVTKKKLNLRCYAAKQPGAVTVGKKLFS